jgi:hypothetical protein
MAIQRFSSTAFTTNDIIILQAEQLAVDQDQAPNQSFEHSMTGLEKGQDQNIEFTNYIQLAEDFIRTNLAVAIATRSTNHLLSITNLGRILHPMEDATSPAHEPFQVWAYNESLWAKAKHVFKERLYPSDLKSIGKRSCQAKLEGAVQWAFDLYWERAKLPQKFFNSKGELDIPPAYLPP